MVRVRLFAYGDDARLNYSHQIDPNQLDGMAALRTAQTQGTRKKPGEKDTEFVKRIVAAYYNANAEVLKA